MAVDVDGTIIVCDKDDHRIRKVTADGEVTTLAGSGYKSFGDTHGFGAHFYYPLGLAVDGDGNVIAADASNRRIRKVTPDGKVTTLAGDGTDCIRDGDGKPAGCRYPCADAIDHSGNFVVAESANGCLRKVEAVRTPPVASILRPQPPSVYTANMEALLADPTFADVTFDVGGTQITAHRPVLSA